ncbi:MAG: glycosyltransferase family 39 protein [Anaerolineae bacterium]|nr:glycosyltransferase family 39 protein [Anaerolineae bacterium]
MSATSQGRAWLRHWPLALVLASAVLVRFWALGRSALLQDEAYYWLWSRRLAPAYYDHPAGVALLIRASTALAGQSEAGIRWLNATLGVVAVAAIYRLTLQVGSRLAASIAAAWIAFAPPCLLTSRFVYTDALQHALLPLALLPMGALLAQPEREASWRQLLLGGALWALVLNTKYSAYLAAALAIGTMLLLRPRLARDGRFWAAVGLAALGLAPVLMWNGAHDWASFRWQYEHFTKGALVQDTAGGRVKNLVDYLGPPLLLFAALGLGRVSNRFGRLLWVLGVGLSLPVALSPANSPRNLSTGVALLVVLAADRSARWVQGGERGSCWVALGVGALLALNALLGIGSLVESLAPTWLPHSQAATHMRQDAAGWREAEGLALEPQATLFSIDYSIAGQLSYYTGRLARSSWGQFRIWGGPALDEICVIALRFADPQLIGERLRQDFAHCSGPEERRLGTGGDAKILRVWRAREPQVPAEKIVADLDLAGLLPEP